MIKAEVSLYPQGREEVMNLTGLSTKFLHEHGLDYDFYLANTSLNTTISGNDEEVWSALRHLLQENRRQNHDVVMVTTLSYFD